MIIPTGQFDPLFANDGVPFRDKMIDYIEREFSDLLGPQVGLVHRENGIDKLAAIYVPPTTDATRVRGAA